MPWYWSTPWPDVKIKLPVLNDITDTHVKVIHKSGDTIVDTKEYEIKEENGQQYVEIETESFSTFELNFYTPTIVNNPQTLDNLTIYFVNYLFTTCLIFSKTNCITPTQVKAIATEPQTSDG